jgi:hypothetical protein
LNGARCAHLAWDAVWQAPTPEQDSRPNSWLKRPVHDTVRPGLTPQPNGNVTAATRIPADRVQTPTSAAIYGCAFGCGVSCQLEQQQRSQKVPTAACCRVRAGVSLYSQGVQRSAPRSDPGEGSPEVNERGSRSSVVTVGPDRGGRRSHLSGSITAYRSQSRGRPPAQRIHRAVAPEPKGLS